MGDRTNGQIIIWKTTPKDAAVLLNFIDDNTMGPDYAPRNLDDGDEIQLGVAYGDNEVSVGLVLDGTGLRDEVPDTAYSVWVDPKWEYMGDLEIQVPGLGLFSAECDANGVPIMSNSELLRLINANDATVASIRAGAEKLTGKAFFDWIAANKPTKGATVTADRED